MTPEPPLVPDFDRLIRQESRRWTGIGVLLFLLGISLGLNGLQFIVARPTLDNIGETTTATNRAVQLLEERTPLFSELQSTELRVECIAVLDAALSVALADGLAAVAVDDDEALQAAASAVLSARSELALVGTDRDPCPGGT